MTLFHRQVELAGSKKELPPHCERTGDVDRNALLTVTVVLRRRGNQPVVLPRIQPVSRAVFGALYGADPNDVRLVENFAHHNHLTVVEASLEKRRMLLRGTIHNLSQAFHVTLAQYRDKNNMNFRGRAGTISVPDELKDVVIAILGLDDRQAAFAHFIRSNAQQGNGTFSAVDLAGLYNFPKGVTGAGQTIGIVELGGGYTTSDLQTYFSGLGINVPSVTAVSVDGGANTPGSDADGEVELDIEVAGAIAPGANIAVYFAPNTDQGFIDAISDAVHDSTRKPSVISISWGGPEESWTQQSRTAMNAALQDAAALSVTVTIACGDNGSTDGAGDNMLHVDFPASSPFALACGGTTVVAANGAITSETVWNEIANNEGATGGGVSNFFARPSYQQNANVPVQPETNFAGRGVPDVSGDADPSTGYQVVVDGQSIIVGGTSAVAPLWAGLIALINQQLGKNVGMLQPTIYALGESVFNDISTGNNDDSNLGFYSAKTGWDPCTGLGSPNGQALLDALTAAGSAAAKATSSY